MGSQTKSRKAVFFFILIGCTVSILFLSYKPILIASGNFLAPDGTGNADVVILEGTELIKEKGVETGMGLLSSGRASCLIIVYHNPGNERVFAQPSNYNLFLSQKLEERGLKKWQLQVIEVPDDHPITFREAQIVLSHLSEQGVKSAILLAEGFHTRRSFWTYKEVGLLKGIKIIPHPYFMKYMPENWWQKKRGIYVFIIELLKFVYYLLCGYIPIKSLLVT
jgi:hypothetical protein